MGKWKEKSTFKGKGGEEVLKQTSKFSPVLRTLRSYLTNIYNGTYYMFVVIIILKVAKSEIGSYTREVAKERERRE